MLRRLFKGRSPLRHPDPRVRAAAVRDLEDAEAEQLAGELAQLLEEDPDPQVRLACLMHVRDRRLLESLQSDPVLGEAATQRLAALPRPGASPEPHPGGTDLLALPPQEAAERLRELSDVGSLVELALKARGELRQAVLEHPALQGAPALAQLEKRSRGHDKSVNRHARTRLDRLKHLHGEAGTLQARAEELAAALGRTPPALQDQAWRERQHQLHERLTGTLDAHQAVAQELTRFGETLPDLSALRPDENDLPPLVTEPAEPALSIEADAAADDRANAAADPAPDPREDPFEPLVAGFQALDRALTEGRSFTELAARRQDLTERWLTAADHRPPSEAQHQVFEAVSHRFRELADAMERLEHADLPEQPAESLAAETPQEAAAHRAHWEAVDRHRSVLKRLAQARRKVRWPDWAPPTAEYARLLETIGALEQELARADAMLQAELATLDELLKELGTAIDDGSLNRARTLLAKARSLHDALPPAAVRSQGRRLGKEAARLAELKDWQTFATGPKRESLVEAMESLAQAPLPAPEQAERIRTLRREWQGLGPVTQAADGRLADRFNAAAERAFEPCRAYFAEQAELRRRNLEERRRICDQLERYLGETDWARADMKAAERIMRAAREEWRRFHPVERHPGREVESRFEALQGQLHDRVKAEWDRNLAAKERLVAEAETLLEADLPLPEKIDTVKRLQRQWREVGITPRRPDQRLWRALRTACDRVFAAREASRQAADAARGELEARLTAELDRFEQALQTRAPDGPPPDPRALRQLALDRLPPDRRRPLTERRAALLDRYGALQAERARVERRARFEALERWDEAMTALESGAAAEAPPAPPEGGAALVEARLACAGGEPPLAAARRLAVRAELAAGCAPRPDEESLRLEIQVERLQAGLSGGGTSEDAMALAQAWCRLGPKTEAFAPLRARLFRALGEMS